MWFTLGLQRYLLKWRIENGQLGEMRGMGVFLKDIKNIKDLTVLIFPNFPTPLIILNFALLFRAMNLTAKQGPT